jgi:hypothetical protein
VVKKKKNREENSCPADKEKKRKEKKRSWDTGGGFALLMPWHTGCVYWVIRMKRIDNKCRRDKLKKKWKKYSVKN